MIRVRYIDGAAVVSHGLRGVVVAQFLTELQPKTFPEAESPPMEPANHQLSPLGVLVMDSDVSTNSQLLICKDPALIAVSARTSGPACDRHRRRLVGMYGERQGFPASFAREVRAISTGG
jgi:hypothetical protein